jgi:glutamyl/glutaminyl-tRNA synthetase
MINYLALLGWHPEGNQELFSVEELIQEFDLARIQKGAGIFDETKLQWFNHEHLRRMNDGEFTKRMKVFLAARGIEAPADLMDIADLMRERYQTLGEAADALVAGEFDFMQDKISYDAALLTKGAKADAEVIKKNLDEVVGLIESIPDELFTEEGVKEVIFPYATAVGRSARALAYACGTLRQREVSRPFHARELAG